MYMTNEKANHVEIGALAVGARGIGATSQVIAIFLMNPSESLSAFLPQRFFSAQTARETLPEYRGA
jgi:hypothetical protein